MRKQEKYKSERYSEFIYNSGLEDTAQIKYAFYQEIDKILADKGEACDETALQPIQDALYSTGKFSVKRGGR